jgi:hypothetical protein
VMLGSRVAATDSPLTVSVAETRARILSVCDHA